MEKKQTAVEWIEKEFLKLESTIGVHHSMYVIIEKAKQMHREDIINSFFEGAYGGDNISGEQYYNETYGGQDGSNH